MSPAVLCLTVKGLLCRILGLLDVCVSTFSLDFLEYFPVFITFLWVSDSGGITKAAKGKYFMVKVT